METVGARLMSWRSEGVRQDFGSPTRRPDQVTRSGGSRQEVVVPYRLSALAEKDLDDIWSYVAEDASPETANRLIDAIFDRFEFLVEQP